MRLTQVTKAHVWGLRLSVWGESWPIHLPLGPYVRVDDMPQQIGLVKHMPAGCVCGHSWGQFHSKQIVKNETDLSPKIMCVEVKLACMLRKLAHPFAIGTICEG